LNEAAGIHRAHRRRGYGVAARGAGADGRFRQDYAAVNETYRSYFAESRLPARTCVGVTGLAYDTLIEIDLVARRPA